MINKDVIIIGAGPSGITASIYLKRAGVDPFLVESYMPGGKLSSTFKIDNYPGYSSINGSDLAFKMMDQLKENNIEINFEEVVKVEKKEEGILVETPIETYLAKSVIIATGTKEKKLEISGENNFLSRGISFCAVCDGGFYKNQPMAIIGGGNSALEEALYLDNLANPLYLIHRRKEFRGDQIVLDQIKKSKSIKILTPYIPLEFKGEEKLESLVLKNVETNEILEIKVSGVFEYVGASANTSFVVNKNILNQQGYVVVNNKMETCIEGIYACGDVIDKELRQIVTATNDGAIAAINAYNYIKNK